MKEAFEAFGAHHGGYDSFSEPRKSLEERNTQSVSSFKSSEDKLSDAQFHLQELDLANETIGNLAIKVAETERVLVASSQNVKYVEDLVTE